MKYQIYAWALLALLATGVVCAADTVPRQYPLPGHGSFALAVPTAWTGTLHQPESGDPPTITFTTKSGKGFKILVTPIYPDLFDIEPPDAEALREHVAAMAVRVGEGSTEKSPKLHRIKGTSGVGYYFSASELKPGPAGFRHVTAGVLGVGNLVVDFSVMSAAAEPQVVDRALTMLRGARHIKPAPSKTKAPTGGAH